MAKEGMRNFFASSDKRTKKAEVMQVILDALKNHYNVETSVDNGLKNFSIVVSEPDFDIMISASAAKGDWLYSENKMTSRFKRTEKQDETERAYWIKRNEEEEKRSQQYLKKQAEINKNCESSDY